MEPITRTPTEPVDYALLSATYGTLLTVLAVTAHRRSRAGTLALPQAAELPVLGLATFALAKLMTKEKVETWIRRPFVDEERQQPRGRRLRYAVGELLTCSRCMGAWAALGVVGLRVHTPVAGRTIGVVLASSALNDWLQSGFTLLCVTATAREER